MSKNSPHILHELAEWLKSNAPNVHASLLPASDAIPPEWPQKLRDYYAIFNGQARHAPFLFPQYGNWLSVTDVQSAGEIWLEMAERFDFDWYTDNYLHIIDDLEGDFHQTIVMDTKTGKIGSLDIEVQEFEVIANSIDILFANLLKKLKEEGYPEKKKDAPYIPPTKERLDELNRQEALKLAEEHHRENSSPSYDYLYMWGKNIFRNHGDPEFNKPNPHIMRLAKKYFDQIPASRLSQKQLREIAFFNIRYREIVKDSE